MIAYTIKIYGQVQGVDFRYSTKRKAEELGLKGFVRNEPDGSVFVEIEGEKESLDKFVEWCKQGPDFAKVEKVTAEKSEVRNYSSFGIL